MSKEYNVEPIGIEEVKEEKECKSCKRGLNNTQKAMVVLSLYMLGCSIYGTIDLVKYLINLF